jgi:hypothetical protein
MRIREITTPTPLYEADSFNSQVSTGFDKAVERYLKKHPETKIPSRYLKFIKALKTTTYFGFAVMPAYKYYTNVTVAKEIYKDKPADLEQRIQLEQGIFATTILSQIGSIFVGEVAIMALAELFGIVPIIGILLARLLQTVGPLINAGLIAWLGSQDGRTWIVNLFHADLLEDVPGFAADVFDTFKKAVTFIIGYVEDKAGVDVPFIGPDHKPVDPNAPKPDSTTTPAGTNTTAPVDPNAPKPDVKPSATPTDQNDPWAIKPNTPPVYPKKPTELKNIVAPTDDASYRTWDRVKRGANGQLQLK